MAGKKIRKHLIDPKHPIPPPPDHPNHLSKPIHKIHTIHQMYVPFPAWSRTSSLVSDLFSIKSTETIKTTMHAIFNVALILFIVNLLVRSSALPASGAALTLSFIGVAIILVAGQLDGIRVVRGRDGKGLLQLRLLLIKSGLL